MDRSKGELQDWSASVYRFRVLMDDGQVIETGNTLGDLIRWEKNREERWGSKHLGVTGLLYLAWLAGRRHGPVITEQHFENWVDHVIDLDADPVKRYADGTEDTDLDDVPGAGIADPTRPDHQGDGWQN